jgi:DNA-directed RNA polymerase sigma subunit (sigma70/sigma32)
MATRQTMQKYINELYFRDSVVFAEVNEAGKYYRKLRDECWEAEKKYERAKRKVSLRMKYLLDNFVQEDDHWQLTNRMRKILKMRFCDRMTLEDVANDFDVTRERIRQLEAKGLEVIKIHYEENKLLQK